MAIVLQRLREQVLVLHVLDIAATLNLNILDILDVLQSNVTRRRIT